MDRTRYVTADQDPTRWAALRPRPGDVVVSTRSKHGTTWAQALLLHMVHGPALPAPLPVLSPWLDHRVEALEPILARLEGQQHRRVIKTHTPLDGLPLDEGTSYVVVARHPLDAALSLLHHIRNLDRPLIARLTGQPAPDGELPDPATWMARWVESEADPHEVLDSLPGVLHHLCDAWARRHHDNVHLVHFADLQQDRAAVVERLADALGIAVPDVGAVVDATAFDAMRVRAAELVPDPVGVVRDPTAFFRAGRSGDGRVDPAVAARYEARAAAALPDDLRRWLHR